MTASWPSELPRPMRQGYQFTRGDGRLRTPNEAGPPRVRRRFSSMADFVTMTIDVSRGELARFNRFYVEEVEHGALPFLMPDPATDGWALLDHAGKPLLTDAGVPLLLAETWLCLFADQLPSTTVIGNRFRVSFQIAVMP